MKRQLIKRNKNQQSISLSTYGTPINLAISVTMAPGQKQQLTLDGFVQEKINAGNQGGKVII